MAKITLNCSKCGGTLEITDDKELFKCQYCGTPYLVERSEGNIRIQKLERRLDTLEAKQYEINAKMELDKVITERQNLIKNHYEQNNMTLLMAGGAICGVALVFLAETFINQKIISEYFYQAELAAGFIGAFIGMGIYARYYDSPHQKNLQELNERELNLREIIERAGNS